MKNIKKFILISVLGAGVCGQNVYADQATQAKIRAVIKSHQNKLNALKTSEDITNFLKILIKDLKEVLKNAPNTPEYKKLKEAVHGINPDQVMTIVTNLKTILNHLEADIRSTIVNSIPSTYRLFLQI